MHRLRFCANVRSGLVSSAPVTVLMVQSWAVHGSHDDVCSLFPAVTEKSICDSVEHRACPVYVQQVSYRWTCSAVQLLWRRIIYTEQTVCVSGCKHVYYAVKFEHESVGLTHCCLCWTLEELQGKSFFSCDARCDFLMNRIWSIVKVTKTKTVWVHALSVWVLSSRLLLYR